MLKLQIASLLALHTAAEQPIIERLLNTNGTDTEQQQGNQGGNIAYAMAGTRAELSATWKYPILLCVEPTTTGSLDEATTKFVAGIKKLCKDSGDDSDIMPDSQCTVETTTGTHTCAAAGADAIKADATFVVKYTTNYVQYNKLVSNLANHAVVAAALKVAVDDGTTTVDASTVVTTFPAVPMLNNIRESTVTTEYSVCLKGQVDATVSDDQAKTRIKAGVDDVATVLCKKFDAFATVTCSSVVVPVTGDDKNAACTSTDTGADALTQFKVTTTLVAADTAVEAKNTEMESWEGDVNALTYATILTNIQTAVQDGANSVTALPTTPAPQVTIAVTDALTAVTFNSITTSAKACVKLTGGSIDQTTRNAYTAKVVELVEAKAPLTPVRGVSVIPASGTCPSARRGRRLSTADTPLQADITAVIDITATGGAALKDTVTTYVDDGVMGTEVKAAIQNGANAITGIDDSVEPTVAVTEAAVVDESTPSSSSTSAPTTSGAAAMVVGHIGALLATYLYVSL